MSRPTDTERGARMAAQMAHDVIAQRDLFPTPETEELRETWVDIYIAAVEALQEESACREALRGC